MKAAENGIIPTTKEQIISDFRDWTELLKETDVFQSRIKQHQEFLKSVLLPIVNEYQKNSDKYLSRVIYSVSINPEFNGEMALYCSTDYDSIWIPLNAVFDANAKIQFLSESKSKAVKQRKDLLDKLIKDLDNSKKNITNRFIKQENDIAKLKNEIDKLEEELNTKIVD